MSEVQNRFRGLSVYNQGECFLSPTERNNVCMKLLLFNFPDKLEAKFWLVSGKLNCGKFTWFLFLKLNIFLEKCETSLKVVAMKFPVLRGDVILLVFTKGPRTCSWSPNFHFTCLFSIWWLLTILQATEIPDECVHAYNLALGRLR